MGDDGKTKKELVRELRRLRKVITESETQKIDKKKKTESDEIFRDLAEQCPNMVFVNQNR